LVKQAAPFRIGLKAGNYGDPVHLRHHFSAFGLRFVVPADKVQNAVNGEKSQLLPKTYAPGLSLTAGKGTRDRDVAQRRPREFAGREGQHIGGFVYASELEIQTSNLFVVGQENANLAIRSI
jgi:hypothetical protein